MIVITDKSRCCGCTACVTSCPVQCIVMRRDKEGFDYPVANPDMCIGCGKCDSVCPVLNKVEKKAPLEVYAAIAEEYRDGSSSGGVFPLLAAEVITSGGIVFGASLCPDMCVGHLGVESLAELESLRGSKYVQSDLYSVFEEVKEALAEGRKVLFSGTPCQISGLNRYLGKRYENLLTVDVACHGVPSPGLWGRYVKALESRYSAEVTDVKFKDKSKSWKNYQFGIESGDRYISVPYMKDPYMALYLQDLTLRPSCYNCPSKGGKSGSDITLADFWGVSAMAPEMNDDKGVSLVIVNTDKGKEVFDNVSLTKKRLGVEATELKNGGFASIIDIPERRGEFFAGVESAKDLISYMSAYVTVKSPFKIVYENIHSFMAKIKRRIMK